MASIRCRTPTTLPSCDSNGWQAGSAQPEHYRFASEGSLNQSTRAVDDDIDLRTFPGLELRSVLYKAAQRELGAVFVDLRHSDDAPEPGQSNVAWGVRMTCQYAAGQKASSSGHIYGTLDHVGCIAR